MLELERSATDSFEASHHLEWAERLRSAELDGRTLSGRVSKRDSTHFGDVPERNPTDRCRAWSVDASRCIRVIESQRWAQPHFHKPTRLNSGEVQGRDRFLYRLFRIAQRAGNGGCPAKRDENKPFHVAALRCVHQVQLPGCVNGLNRVSSLVGQCRGRS